MWLWALLWGGFPEAVRKGWELQGDLLLYKSCSILPLTNLILGNYLTCNAHVLIKNIGISYYLAL